MTAVVGNAVLKHCPTEAVEVRVVTVALVVVITVNRRDVGGCHSNSYIGLGNCLSTGNK